MYKSLLTMCCIVSSYFALGQTPPFIGASANGSGYTSSSVQSSWSLFNNPAGLAMVKDKTVALSFDTDPSFKPFNRIAFCISAPFLRGGAGIGMLRFGDELYNEQIIAAGFAHTLGITTLGVRCTYLQYGTSLFGKTGVLAFSLGGITDLTPWLKIGAQVVNVNQPNLTDEEKLSTLLILNTTIKASEKVWVFAEVEKDIQAKPLLKAGMEYKIHPKIFTRTGFHPSPVAAFFGFGFHLTKMQFDYAFTWRFISLRHQVSLQYTLKTK